MEVKGQFSDVDDDLYDRRNPKRSCRSSSTAEKNKSVDFDEETFSGSSSDSRASDGKDEDFSLTKPRQKRKKRIKKQSTPRSSRELKPKKNKIFAPSVAPSFDQVMRAQIVHATRFMVDEDYISDNSSINEKEEVAAEVIKREQEKPTPDPQAPKKKRIIIYPWRPIGITGGRPVNDVSKL